MMRAFFIFILLLASILLGVYLQRDPGYVLIAIHHWSIESTLSVAMVVLCLAFIMFHTVLLMLHWLTHLPTAWKNWHMKRRIQHAQAKTRQGLIEFSEGHWLQAKNHLIKALPDTDTPLLNYLTAARAAQEMGDNTLRDDYLRQAQQSMPEAKIAVELTQAQLQLANRQWEQALATLRHLQDMVPHHPYVLKLLMNLYQEVKDWPQLIALLPELKRKHVVSDNNYLRLQQNAYLQAMLDLIRQDQYEVLVHFIHALPKQLSHDVALMSAYCRYLLSKQREAETEIILRRCLRKGFDEQLIGIYGEFNYNDAQLHFAESFLKDHPHSASLCLCLGRLSKAKHLWGKAKVYLEQSIEYGATPAAFWELGQLLEQLSDQAGACTVYQEGLLLVLKQPVPQE